MNGRTLLVILLLLSLLVSSDAFAVETYFKFNIQSPDELQRLTKVVSIDNVVGLEVYAYANDRELAAFEALGYPYTVLPPPGMLIDPKMATSRGEMRDWDAYPTYDAYVAMMYQFEADYPLICDVQCVGYTVQGREILFAKISDNVHLEEDEPEVMHTATMHGNETTGYILILRLIDSILVSYGSDPRITGMVDNMEIWLNPLANPDGTYYSGNHTVSGARRYNANGVDLNRNFPDPQDGPHPDGNPWQPETVAMMNLAEQQRFVISANHHGGAEVVNYPWDTWAQRHADDQWFIDVCRAYADTVHAYAPGTYMDDYDNGITNGWDWYTINGGRQDYMTYFRGGREVTIELSNTFMPAGSQLPAFWEYNKRSLLAWLENGLYGIRGIVTDLSTGDPVDATVTVLNHDIDSARVFTDPDVGDYHRMIEAGTYDLQFSAYGYVTQTIEDVFVPAGGTTILNVQMELLYDDPLLKLVSHDAGLVNPGDAVYMSITLSNEGGQNAQNVTGTLLTGDSFVTVTQSYSTYPDIVRLGGQATSNSSYEFQVSPSCSLLHTVDFELYLSASGGYSDTISFSLMIGQQVEDFETGTFARFPWEMGGNQPWGIVAATPYEGSYCARSGVIGNSQSSSMFLTLNVTSGGELSFYYKVSSEAGYDFLEFYIDGVRKNRWSGNVGWSEASFPVTAGLHTFKWQYIKDYWASSGSDCAWIDFITFPGSTVPIEITTEQVPDWTVGLPYSVQLAASGGSGPHVWSDLYGDLDGTGLSLSSAGLLSGVPTSTGTTSFTAHVEDNSGASDDKLLTFEINDPPDIVTETLSDWTEGLPYSGQLESVGGTGGVSWSDLNGDLMGTGISLSHTGLLSGTPMSAGAISFVAHVQDAVGAYDEEPFSFTINPPVEIVPATLADWTVGVPYSEQLEATGGTGTLVWSDPNNHLAGTGLSVSSAGLLSGVPSTPGQISFTAHVDDQVGAYDNEPFSMTMNPALSITTSLLPDGTVGEPYSEQLQVTGGTGDKMWSDLNGDLEGAGLNLSSGGLLSGTPISPGPVGFTAHVEDQIGAYANRLLSVMVMPDWICGDVDATLSVDIDDVVYLISYVFSGGPSPEPMEAGDVDCSGDVNIDDVVYLIDYIFAGGPEPCADCW